MLTTTERWSNEHEQQQGQQTTPGWLTAGTAWSVASLSTPVPLEEALESWWWTRDDATCLLVGDLRINTSEEPGESVLSVGPCTQAVKKSDDGHYVITDSQNSEPEQISTRPGDLERRLDEWAQVASADTSLGQLRRTVAQAHILPEAMPGETLHNRVLRGAAKYRSAEQFLEEANIPAIGVYRRRFYEDSIVDGEPEYHDEDVEFYHPDSWTGAVDAFVGSGVGGSGYNPDGSDAVDHTTGEREEVHVAMLGPWGSRGNQSGQWIRDEVEAAWKR